MRISVIAHPNSRQPRIETDLLGTLHIYVSAPPLKNRANLAIIQALANHYHVRPSKVLLLSGTQSRTKIFEISTPINHTPTG